MKKQLKYIDGTSDKFWQIEVADTAYTVTYGRNGTPGLSQTKSFSSHDDCLKAAEKLLKEKMKKGYSENGEVVAVPSASKSGKDAKTDIKVVLEAYDAILLSRNLQALLPFLMEHSKGNLEALKKHFRKCKRYWLDYIDLVNEPEYKKNGSNWGVRGDAIQSDIIVLSAIALSNKTDINPWDQAIEIFKRAEEPFILAVLKWAKPTWIAEFILEKCKRSEWIRFNYLPLRFLEDQSLIEFQPELYALSLASYNEWSAKIKPRAFITRVLNDKTAYERDVPELFNYETGLHQSYFRDKDTEPYNAHSLWQILFNSLLDEGKLSRAHFIEQTILIQTKDWNNSLKSFFRKRLTELNPVAGELLPFQENIFACLQYTYAPVVNFAMDLSKLLYQEKEFDVNSFLDWLEPVLMANDNKAAIKSVLPVLEKLNKLYPELNQKITLLTANVYMVPDLSLQERATKLLLKIATDKDEVLKEKLSDYVSLMQGNISTDLSQLLHPDIATMDLEETVVYRYEPKKEKVLLQEVELPEDWNDIVFLFGKFMTSDEVLDAELLLHVYINQRHLFPENYAEQLQPYGKQLEKKYFDSTYKSYIGVFLQQKIYNYDYVFKVQDSAYHKIKTLLLIKPYLHAVQQRIDSRQSIPMLSFPSHYPYWVAPKILLERLITCQQLGVEINKLDLSMAISRMPRENIAEAIPLLEQLNADLRDLMAYCLGTEPAILLKKPSILNKLLSKIKTATDDGLEELWAMAARTYYPNETFPEFNGTSLKNVPFVVSPFFPEIRIEERWNEYVNYQTKKKERSTSWYEIHIPFPGYQQTTGYFLYGLDLFSRKNTWDYLLHSAGNVYHWNSLMPQNTDALAVFLLRSSCVTSAGGGEELKGFLNIVNQYGFLFSDTTLLLYACTFFQDKKELRLMSAEVLINLIEKQSVDLNLLARKFSFLAFHKYGPFLRLVECMGMLKEVSSLHNSACLQLIDGIFEGLSGMDRLPVNFKKLVEHYVDVLYKTNLKPSPPVITLFEKLMANTALKKLAAQILNR